MFRSPFPLLKLTPFHPPHQDLSLHCIWAVTLYYHDDLFYAGMDMTKHSLRVVFLIRLYIQYRWKRRNITSAGVRVSFIHSWSVFSKGSQIQKISSCYLFRYYSTKTQLAAYRSETAALVLWKCGPLGYWTLVISRPPQTSEKDLKPEIFWAKLGGDCCGRLALAGHQVPTNPLNYSPSSDGQERVRWIAHGSR